MFVVSNERFETRVPIRIWLENEGQMEESCLTQAVHLAKLPFVYRWVSLMPDTHTGKGMPIGGVIATRNVIIPNAVGSDFCTNGSPIRGDSVDYNRKWLTYPTACGRYFKKYSCRY